MEDCFDGDLARIGATVEQVLLLQRHMEQTLAELLKGQTRNEVAIVDLSRALVKTTTAACSSQSEVDIRRVESTADRLVKLPTVVEQSQSSMQPDQGVQAFNTQGSMQPDQGSQSFRNGCLSKSTGSFSSRSFSALSSMHRIKIAPGMEERTALDEEEAEDKLDEIMGLGMYSSEHSMVCRQSFMPEIGHRSFMLDPHGKPRIVHDLISLVVLGFDAMSAPVILAWDIPIDGFLYMFNILSVGFWSCDIFANFLTGFYDFLGELETRPKLVARNYLTSWFLPDITVVLVDFATLSMRALTDSTSETGAGVLRLTKVGRFLRLARLFRLARAGQAFARLTDASIHFEVIVDILKPLIAIVLVNHLLACLWWTISRWLPSDTGFSWINEQVSVSAEVSYAETDVLFQYLTAMHWSLTQQTPGSMETVPRNSIERAFNCFCLLFGMLLFSSIISTLSAKMMQHHLKQKDNVAKLAVLRRYLTDRVQPSLAYAAQFKAIRAMSTNAGKPMTMNEVSAIAILPQALQRSIRVDLCEKHLKHPLFRWWLVIDSKGAHNLCHEAIDFAGLAAEDHLFFPRTSAASAYIMLRGAAVYIPEVERDEKLQVAQGQFFCEAALWCKWKHVGELTATAGCELLSISSSGLVRCLDQDAVVKHVVTEYGRFFHTCLMTPQIPDKDQANDIFVASTEFESILPSLPVVCRQLFGAVAVKAAGDGRGRGRRSVSSSAAADIRQGLGCLFLNWEGEVERIISSIALRLAGPDGKVLMQLGVRTAERAHASLTLLSSQVQDGENQMQAFERLLNGVCAPFADSISTTHIEMQVWKETKHQSDRTTYSRTVHHAVLTCPADCLGDEFDAETPMACDPSRRRTSLSESLSSMRGDALPEFNISTYALADAVGDIVFVGWLSPEEMHAFTSPAGEAMLQRMLNRLVLEPSIVEAARAHFADALGLGSIGRSCV